MARGGIRLCSGRPSEKQAGVHAIPYTAALHKQTQRKEGESVKEGEKGQGRPAGFQKPGPGPVVVVQREAGSIVVRGSPGSVVT